MGLVGRHVILNLGALNSRLLKKKTVLKNTSFLITDRDVI